MPPPVFEALMQNTTGSFNTAVGATSLNNNTTGGDNTAAGSAALNGNTAGGDNTAVGYEAMLDAATGDGNTAVGSQALLSNTTGNGSTAIGYQALDNNTADGTTAVGYQALAANTSGYGNTAVGYEALANTATDAGSPDLTAVENTAAGCQALSSNTVGNGNTALGYQSLMGCVDGALNVAVVDQAELSIITSGTNNVAIGEHALYECQTGNFNIAIGSSAGNTVSSGSYNIDIGTLNDPARDDDATIRIGEPGTQTQTFIAGIRNTTLSGQAAVYINSAGQLGVAPSSRRFKDDIRDMSDASGVLYALRPVRFRYKAALDPHALPEYGLVAEEVEKIDPGLVVHDPDGRPFTVRYEQVNAMLLNEFLKEHARVEAQAKALAAQQEEFAAAMGRIRELTASVQAQAAQLQKVSLARGSHPPRRSARGRRRRTVGVVRGARGPVALCSRRRCGSIRAKHETFSPLPRGPSDDPAAGTGRAPGRARPGTGFAHLRHRLGDAAPDRQRRPGQGRHRLFLPDHLHPRPATRAAGLRGRG